MTVRDRRQLQNMVELIARRQRKSALPDKRAVAAPATTISGAGKAGGAASGAALAIDYDAPQYRYKERVAALISDGLTPKAAEECVRELIHKKLAESAPAPVGATVRIDRLAVGQRFRSDVQNERGAVVESFTGCLLYHNSSRARVLLDAGPVTEKSFNRKTGESVVINSSGGRTERNFAPETPVVVLPGTEDLSLHLAKKEVHSQQSSNPKTENESEEIMAAKKAAKKTNGAAKKAANGGAAKPSKRAEFNAKEIKVLADKNPKREGSASFKRFALYKNGMTVGAFIEKGGTLGDVHYDTAHKFISVS